MLRLRFPILIFACLAAALPGACNVLGPADEKHLTLDVAPYTVECVGVAVQRCLLVRARPGGEWERLYEGIEGFVFEPGHHYTLRVARRHVPDPPADGSSLVYRLVRLLAKVPA